MRTIKLWLTTIATLWCSLTANAHDFKVGGIYYTITSSADLTVEVTYRGSFYSDYSNEYSGAVTIPSTATYNSETYSVTSIGNCAFYGCSNLTSITIPESVTSIGDGAFYGCSSLTSITIPESVTSIGGFAFSGCTSLTAIVVAEGNKVYDSRGGCNAIIETSTNTLLQGCSSTIIPEGVTSIGYAAFYYCRSLTAINIPEGVTSIGDYAFSGCTSLTAIVVAEGNKVYDSRGGCNAIIETSTNTLLQGCSSTIIPEGVTSIGNYAFRDCSSLTSITIPEGVTSIGDYAFSGCTSLTAINLPESVTSIGSSAFKGCTGELIVNCNIPSASSISAGIFYGSNFTKVTIGGAVTSIGDYAFYYCRSLTAINIPEGVTSIGDYAFSGCTSLTAIVVAEGNKVYDSRGGCNAIIETSTNTLLQGCSSTIIPEGVTSIGNYAFRDCSSLTAITIPEGVTSIGYAAFYYCRSLTAITLPESVTSIGSSAFEGCTGELIVNCNIPSASSTSAGIFYGSNFTKVTIGGAVTSIGDYAFYGCSSLTAINILEGVTSIGGSAFYYCRSLTAINIPESVTSIGDYAFYGTAWYNSLPDGLVYIGKVLYKYKGTMPENTSIEVKEGIVSISPYAFYDCTSLTAITLPEGVTSIGGRAFYDCSSLTAITLPEGVTSIGDEAFKGCQSLYKVINISNLDIQKGSTEHGMVGYYAQKVIKADADDNVKGYYFYTSEENIHYLFHYGGKETALTLPEDYNGDDYIIDDKAFANNGNIISASIPQTVGEIGSHAFAGCSNLASVDIARGVMSIGDNAFENCTSLTAIIFPKNLTAIGSSAFKGCSGLTSIGFDEDLEHIGDNAFENCTSLTTIIFPKNLTAIGSSAFKGCSGLTSVFISANVDTYGKEAFEGCEAVETLMVMGSVMPTIPSDKLTSITLFSPVPLKTSEFANKVYRNATVYVPKGSLERYQAADVWKNFWTIQEFDTTGIAPQPVDTNQQTTVVYDLQGRRISNEANLKEGIYIVNGRKVAIK